MDPCCKNAWKIIRRNRYGYLSIWLVKSGKSQPLYDMIWYIRPRYEILSVVSPVHSNEVFIPKILSNKLPRNSHDVAWGRCVLDNGQQCVFFIGQWVIYRNNLRSFRSDFYNVAPISIDCCNLLVISFVITLSWSIIARSEAWRPLYGRAYITQRFCN